ncbi:TspO/MBR family protein [Aureimonas leprariae]|uniref:Tryptophan-rich sensory protein n=1 Tax=Plantimonas leprariae TaxID=2615207 RepID=A0A7V7PKJ6_9HYPH|nr:TspO/MBR family protein [Aureimonas leprariae]KAB0676427.1 tryptophan-rich sensory protein [Aureimonas leprariae]
MTLLSIRSALLLGLMITLVLGGGMVIGLSNPPGDWYAALAKPSFTPPDWLFPVAWTLLYVLVAVAGWLVLLRGPALALLPWAVQLALNFAWSPTFFGAQRIGFGLGVIAALLVAILAFLAATIRQNRAAFACFVPYGVWVAYATALNLSILRLN